MICQKCLLVDDSEADHLLLELAVKKHMPRSEIIHAYDGEEALDLLTQLGQECPVILLDLNMPGMNGHDFLLEYAKKEGNICPVVVITSSTREDERAQCLRYGFVKGYFVKPLQGEELAAMVN